VALVKSVFILGGTGQIGRATARRLAADGFAVTVAGRDESRLPAELAALGVAFARVDRSAPGELEAVLGDAVGVLVDVVPYTAADARQLIGLAGRFGSLIAISSASVYTDADGRTLDEATGEDDFPRLPVPIPERQRTVPPGDDTYSTRKSAVERALLEADGVRATIVRPCAIHGPGTRWSREWYFVKRVLDRRRAVVLARRGASRFHTTSVENLAELIRLAALRPGNRVFNCADPDPPTALEIGRAVAAALDHSFHEVLLPGPEQDGVGDHPWNVPRPLVVDMTAAEIELGYRPVTTYAHAVVDTARWLVEATSDRDWQDVLPVTAQHMSSMFDYAAEDELIRNLTDL
jgi:nucleoside-diphosphate-sugar epimerase